jgi:hypothetical protein
MRISVHFVHSLGCVCGLKFLLIQFDSTKNVLIGLDEGEVFFTIQVWVFVITYNWVHSWKKVIFGFKSVSNIS